LRTRAENEIIEATYDVRWGEPVWVRVGYGIPDAVKGPRQALIYLDVRWPAERGDGFMDARARCVDALNKKTTCETARAAFVRAAREARMLAS
jgi:hypothetical protein